MVILSTIKAEYIAAIHAIKETIWLQRLFKDIKFLQDNLLTIFSDNQNYIFLLRYSIIHACIKHVEIHYDFIYKKIKNSNINLVFSRIQDIIIDILTKGLTCE